MQGTTPETPVVFVRAEEYPPTGLTREQLDMLSPGDVANTGVATFEQVLGGIERMAAEAGQRLKDAGPSKVTLEFDLTVGGEAGWFMIGKAEASAAAKVTLEWDLKPEPKQ